MKRLEAEIDIVLDTVPKALGLLSIKGIGHISAAALSGEIGDVNAYGGARDIIKLAGLNRYEISSGKSVGKRRITKQGRHLLAEESALHGR